MSATGSSYDTDLGSGASDHRSAYGPAESGGRSALDEQANESAFGVSMTAAFAGCRSLGQFSPSLSARLAASTLLGVPVLRSTLVTWTLTVLSLMNRSRAISALVRPATR